MSKEAGDHRPPSPPQSGDGEFGLNAGRFDHFQEPYTPPRTVRPMSRAELSYGLYGNASQYPPVPQQMFYAPPPQFLRQIPYHTPPRSNDPGMVTRSGKALGSPIEPKHARGGVRTARAKKNKTKAGKSGAPVIDQALSILTKDYKVPVRDMGAWVNRSVEERLKEVEKKKGYVSRPMNSFMLYRSAYAERVKQFCKENNHQVVSQVTGQSWPMEPPHIREMYEKYALLERDNHAAAHPTYKFAPNKSGKKRGRDDDQDSDSDDEWRGGGGTKRSRPSTRGETRSMSSTPFEAERATRYTIPLYPQQSRHHPSSYQAMNPHGPPPFSLGPNGLSGGYYQPQTIPYGQQVDDVKYERMDDPFLDFNPGSQLIGMPDSGNNQLLTGPENMDAGMFGEPMLDPRLAEFDPNYQYVQFDHGPEQAGEVPQEYGYGAYPTPSEPPHSGGQIHPGMATLTEGWTNEIEPGSDFDNEFRQWS